jgi:hypothetical protein
MIEFIKKFLTSYLFPIVKQAVAQAVVNQIEDAVYGPRGQRSGGYVPRYNQYGRRMQAVPDED